MSAIESILRWLHVFVGIIWIGHLYFFNFVNGAFAGTMDADTKKKVVPELMPRALFWFRYGALWTWITGVLLLAMVFYHGGTVLEDGNWTLWTFLMIAVTFLAAPVYDVLMKSIKDIRIAGAVGLVLLGVILFLMQNQGGFSYRGYNIHAGVLFGTIMAFNVWMRIWPAQKKIITAIKNGEKPDPDVVALAGTRSRHNTYLSMPLLWAMLNTHTTYFAGGNLCMSSQCGWVTFLAFTIVGWAVINLCYRQAAQVKGF